MRVALFCPACRRLRHGRVIVAAFLLVLGGTGSAATYRDLRPNASISGNRTIGEQKAATCVACHGADGIPLGPTFPRLAGQRIAYLYHRLVSFKQANPNDPYYSKSPMAPLARGLSDADIRDLAAYFSSQTASRALPVAENLLRAKDGQSLYSTGDFTRGVAPCQGCHGEKAEGPPANSGRYNSYPALRGQSTPYLIARLTDFRTGSPADTTNAFIMHGIAQALDDRAIEAIAEWLGSLAPIPDH